MLKNIFKSRSAEDGERDSKIAQEKKLNEAALKTVKNAAGRLQVVLDQMTQNNEERAHVRHD